MDGDFLLIRKMKQGSEAAFDVFVRKYYQEILTYCSYHCPDKSYAEDMAQETFVRFFARLPEYQYRGKTKNYLYTVAGNLCKDYLKKMKELPLEELEIQTGAKECPADDVVNRLTVEWALHRLPEELKEIVILYYFQELKMREIADMLEIGLPLVKYRLKRAKEQLGKMLGEEGGYESGRTTYCL